MQSIATTTISVLRGNVVDKYGYDSDTEDAYLTNIPCSLLEQRRYVATPDQEVPTIVRFFIARVPGNTDVNNGDRVRDENTDEIYMIDSYSQVQNPSFVSDLRLELRRA